MLKRSRLDVEGKINKQFMEQIRQLKRIFEKDVREREEKENNIIASLKVMYKSALSSIQH